MFVTDQLLYFKLKTYGRKTVINWNDTKNSNTTMKTPTL